MTITLRGQGTAFLRRRPGLARECLDALTGLAKHYPASAVSGVRRCGKTVLLRQLARRLGERRCHYCDLEDERLLEFTAERFDELIEALSEAFGERKTLLLDGLTTLPDWEALLERARGRGLRVVFTTASNQDAVPGLRLHPLSFREYVRLRGASSTRGLERPVKRGRMKALLARYLTEGGMPDRSPDALKDAYERILYRDLAARHGVRQLDALRGFLLELKANTGRKAPLSELRRRLGLGSPNTLKTWLAWALESGLFFAVPARGRGLPKLYCADHALAVGLTPERALENAVAVELLRRGFRLSHLGGAFIAERKGRSLIKFICEGEDLAEVRGKHRERLPAWEWLVQNPAAVRP
jgi:hypothetical protein